ncbi:FMN-binding glutamate synthase family protein, partial [Polynucleobacter necessarius]|uniref:glutamate synthase-related protein n=1 Tax=Polynucleobacter necessarius TaxID=576610 RepID=UPI0011AE7431
MPTKLPSHDFRVTIGGKDCKHPYSASIFNISAMSFGSLSANAVMALNLGAYKGGFAHDTGEGSISIYHRVHGGDLIWEIGSGYFGCRNPDSTFNADKYTENAIDPQVKMIEIKLSQGAKPGHGGILPGSKVTPEIAEARGVKVGESCISPNSHSAFSSPLELMHFIQKLRDLSGGKPVGFHDTGEGSISIYHRVHGGDLIWEIGSGYFGCRNPDSTFNADKYTENAIDPQVKMIEIKLSQGAKPGHGGILPGSKVTPEIAEARGVKVGESCISPNSHSAFSSPLELMHFIQKLRDLSGGKPVGFKLCIGHPWEWFGIVKAMLETNITPDFIVVDGSEGGTGASPVEFTNHVGTPLQEGLRLVHNTLVGTNLR